MQNDLLSKDNLTQQSLVELFRNAYLPVEQSNSDYFVKESYRIWFLADDAGRYVKFYTLIKPKIASSELQILRGINQVNSEHIMFRNSSHPGYIEIAYYLWVEGGVSKKNVVQTFKFFSSACSDIVNELDKYNVVD